MFELWLATFVRLAYDLVPKIEHNFVSKKKYCTIKRKQTGNNDFSTMKRVKEYTTFSQYKKMEERMQHAWMNKK